VLIHRIHFAAMSFVAGARIRATALSEITYCGAELTTA